MVIEFPLELEFDGYEFVWLLFFGHSHQPVPISP
jgi:hypothetical protein